MASRWNLLWAVPWMVVSALTVEAAVWLPLYLAGLVVVPLASRLADKTERPSKLYSRLILCYKNRILDELWGNHEDGIAPDGWTVWRWFLRNPVTNLRFWPVISTKPASSTRWIGSPAIEPGCRFIAWNGPYVGCRWEGSKLGFWLGWKVNPRDAVEIPTDDYRRWGIGIAMQVLRENA
jgi:hypothetical protein